jgi:nitroreductase
MEVSLTAKELLTTTRAVRKRLDLDRPVEREVIEECISIAQQAPTALNLQNWHFVVVIDPTKKAQLAKLFRKGWETCIRPPMAINNIKFEDPKRNATQKRIISSAEYLVEHLAQVPVHVIPCIAARTEGQSTVMQSTVWGSIAPAAWSFMLAARSFGLGTSWTTFHLFYEEEAANILNIPYKEVMQAALIPVAYTIGTDFKPALRNSVHAMLHWNTW